jgi:uncharacterized protein YabN with tetrapyrrole methylase and pyrophosphatase domain
MKPLTRQRIKFRELSYEKVKIEEQMKEFKHLVDILNRLRDPEKGCPWDLKQTSHSLIPNFVEELYEAVEAIENNDTEHLREELGDLLLHIVFQAKIAEEQGDFTIRDVLEDISEKLKRRHPHVFGEVKGKDEEKEKRPNPESCPGDEEIGSVITESEVKLNWERIKLEEKGEQRKSVLGGIPKSMPALIYSQRMQEKAASVGFDWSCSGDVLDKIKEEVGELKDAIESDNREEIIEEMGDLLFTLVNFSRKMGIDSESALRKASQKFFDRFQRVEKYHQDNGKNIYDSSMEILDELWEVSKKDI